MMEEDFFFFVFFFFPVSAGGAGSTGVGFFFFLNIYLFFSPESFPFLQGSFCRQAMHNGVRHWRVHPNPSGQSVLSEPDTLADGSFYDTRLEKPKIDRARTNRTEALTAEQK